MGLARLRAARLAPRSQISQEKRDMPSKRHPQGRKEIKPMAIRARRNGKCYVLVFSPHEKTIVKASGSDFEEAIAKFKARHYHFEETFRRPVPKWIGQRLSDEYTFHGCALVNSFPLVPLDAMIWPALRRKKRKRQVASG
jgi:hypothetical protein